MRSTFTKDIIKILLSVLTGYVGYRSCIEFYHIAWGTGEYLGEFSPAWFAAFITYAVFCLGLLGFSLLSIWKGSSTLPGWKRLVSLRERLGSWRIVPAIFILLGSGLIFQYTVWGIVFQGVHIRILVGGLSALFLAISITRGMKPAGWGELITALVLMTAVYSLLAALKNVTAYPFSLGWSEGNRLWDYSLLFGSDLYEYALDNPPVAYLDIGRQFSGGLPYLLPGLTIWQARLWLASMNVIPYLVLGGIAFRTPGLSSRLPILLSGLWAWMFLMQGPIHTPLIWCAALVAFAWRKPLWLAMPLVFAATYFAQATRFTYIFAPAIWSVMLEFAGAAHGRPRPELRDWGRAAAVGMAGLLGGPLLPTVLSLWNSLKGVLQAGGSVNGTSPIAPPSVSVNVVSSMVSDQPLLWYRLLPNATYGNGILLGLLIAVVPMIVFLLYLWSSRTWSIGHWQKLAIVLPLLAFLIVGLIVSTKIGGGGDLHNMDMFLIAFLFTVALAWSGGGAAWFGKISVASPWVKLVVISVIVIPGFNPLMSLRPISFAEDVHWLATFVDVEKPKLMGSLPARDRTESTLDMVRDQVLIAKSQGDVLFMDQRQLLTFGYIRDVPLIWEYEKKALMDKALSADAAFFEPFYRDLAVQRFSLIISDPLKAPIKDSDYQFGEENNAWVKWVAIPVMCYYEPLDTLPEFRLQLLVPKQVVGNCSPYLP